MTMTMQQHQGLHGEGFVFALASSAGLLVSRPALDVDGVDWMIGHPGPLGKIRSPKIEVQVKTATSLKMSDGHWYYRLSAAHFNALAGPGFAVPRFLVLLAVPQASDVYAVCDTESMRLSHAAYWASFADRDLQPTDVGDAQTVRVSVPRRNLLTPSSLRNLLAGELEVGTP